MRKMQPAIKAERLKLTEGFFQDLSEGMQRDARAA